jgi:hypothetical protein
MNMGCRQFLRVMEECPNLKRRVNAILDGAPCTHPLKCFRKACAQYALVYPACKATATRGWVTRAWACGLTPTQHRQVAAAHQIVARAKEILHTYSRLSYDDPVRLATLADLHRKSHISNPVRHTCDKLVLRMLANAQKRLGFTVVDSSTSN